MMLHTYMRVEIDERQYIHTHIKVIEKVKLKQKITIT